MFDKKLLCKTMISYIVYNYKYKLKQNLILTTAEIVFNNKFNVSIARKMEIEGQSVRAGAVW